MPTHNLFVISLNEKGSKTSRFEIHIFQRTGIVKDQYLLKPARHGNGSFPFQERRPSVFDLHARPMFHQVQSQETPTTSDRSTSPTISSDSDKFHKCVAVEYLPAKVKAFAYNETQDVLMVGLASGLLHNYKVQIAAAESDSKSSSAIARATFDQSDIDRP